MTNRSLQHLLKLSVLTSAAVLALSTRADLQGQKNDQQESKDNRKERNDLVPLATGQFVTPIIIKDAVQQYLNPGLPAYPDFIAGEAVRSQLSPDGTTLAIITAGQNSLYKPDGTVDTANSTQFIFLYNVEGPNRTRPALTQVIQQVNAHVGLVFSPDGSTLYAAGGNDDAVYNEWKREFDQFVANGNLPNLSLVRISHDHMGNFANALGGFNTPETQQADSRCPRRNSIVLWTGLMGRKPYPVLRGQGTVTRDDDDRR